MFGKRTLPQRRAGHASTGCHRPFRGAEPADPRPRAMARVLSRGRAGAECARAVQEQPQGARHGVGALSGPWLRGCSEAGEAGRERGVRDHLKGAHRAAPHRTRSPRALARAQDSLKVPGLLAAAAPPLSRWLSVQDPRP